MDKIEGLFVVFCAFKDKENNGEDFVWGPVKYEEALEWFMRTLEGEGQHFEQLKIAKLSFLD